MATITADLTTGFAVELRAGDQVWYADEPTDVGGTDTGPNPYELLISAVGACTAITISMYCQRKGWDLHSVSAKYDLDKVHIDDCADCDDDEKGYIDRVRSEIFIEGVFDDEQRARLADIARRCPVHKTLDNGVSFTTETIFVG
ncbi:MAG: osmotically inducible protein C [Acidimicrobiales bacterium]|nr:MAG: osmotically inducible protein C [Acidimicrobiales bacterium]